VRARGFHTRKLPLRLERDLDLEVRLSEEEKTSGTPAQQSSAKPGDGAKSSPPPASPAPVTNRAGRGSTGVPGAARGKKDAGELYGEFPKSKPSEGKAPPLDTTNPWAQ